MVRAGWVPNGYGSRYAVGNEIQSKLLQLLRRVEQVRPRLSATTMYVSIDDGEVLNCLWHGFWNKESDRRCPSPWYEVTCENISIKRRSRWQ